MNNDCQTFRTRMTDYLERSLPLAERERLAAHRSTCESCRSALEMTRDLIAAFGDLEEAPVPAGFEARWRARLDAVAPAARRAIRRPWWKPVAPPLRPVALWSAGVAVAAVMIAVWLNPQDSPRDRVTAAPRVASAPAHGEPVHVNFHQEHTLRIWFDAKEPVENVRFHLQLPEGLALVTDYGVTPLSDVRWMGTLQAGKNLIAIPIKGAERGRWTVTASLEKGSVRKERTIDVLVNGI